MKIEQYDTVLLKDGRTATIVEIFSKRCFLADVGSSPADWNTIDITIDDIATVVSKSGFLKVHEEITDGIKKSVVEIRFENEKKFSYYNDKFDLHVGDVVYVDGKLEGIKGRVVEVNYNFKIKLSDYKKVIAVVDTDVSGKFFMAGSHFMAFSHETLPKEKVKLWFMPPQSEEDEMISGSDNSFFNLDDLKKMDINEDVAERGYDYYMGSKVAYIELNGNKGYAIVEGTKPYEVEFKYEDGKISNLTCDCFCTYKCKHEFATMLQLKESLEQIKKYFSKEYEQTEYFSAIRKGTLFSLAIDGKAGKSFEI